MRRAARPASRDRPARARPSAPRAARPVGTRRGGAARWPGRGPAPRGRRRRAAAGVRTRPAPADRVLLWTLSTTSALDGGPGRGPGGVVLAGNVGPPVQALGDRGRPVPDVAEVALVIRVVA